MIESRAFAALLELVGSETQSASAPQLDAAEWDVLVDEAVRNGVAPLAYDRLSRRGGWAAPEGIVQHLKARYVLSGLVNLRLYGRLAEVLRSLADAAIDVVVLKGAFLAQLVYGDPALRPMGDVDLLVRRDDLARAARAMSDLGWRSDPAAAAAPRAYGHELPPFEFDGVHVELHWSIEDDGSPFAIGEEVLWQRAVAARIGGVRALALSPVDLVLHLCLHTAYGHGWLQFDGGLRPLCDIDACLRHYGGTFDWPRFVARADAWGVRHCAWLTLVMARDLLRTGVPADVFDRLASAPVDARVVDAARGLVLGSHYRDLARVLPVLGRAWMDKRWRHLPLIERWRAHMLPGRETLASEYPSLGNRALRPLRPLAHWADLASDAARVSFGRHGRSLLARERARMALLDWLESSPAGLDERAA